ncbi:MAG TPA: hypothetical protein DCK98_17285 [Chloroflexi bacterium]|jgi:Na+-transporting methylmalonyl-CoA/oxaloacetate decarboxylase beta subunit|nr:hypothetical protein [Chloroflexota bacterium]HAL26781.1 hypothetical protein [Chloroflexota bacterium]
MGIVILATILALVVAVALLFALVALRRASRPRPALPENCGDCVFMIPRAKVYKRETLEDADGIVQYLCQQRWIEITPYSPRCELGKSRTRLTTVPD